MVILTKCNRCEFSNEDEELFTNLVVHLPESKEKSVSHISDLPQKWAARESAARTVVFNSRTPRKTPSVLYLDLCPECTVWFQSKFDLSKAQVKEFD